MASDHIPFSVVLNPGNLPLLMSDDESIRIGKIGEGDEPPGASHIPPPAVSTPRGHGSGNQDR